MSPTRESTAEQKSKKEHENDRGQNGYTIPVLSVKVPAPLVEVGFWGALTGTAILGVVDAPLALLVGAGVAVARHHRS